MSVQQYLRQFSLKVGTTAGNALEFSDFRCVFEIRRGDHQTPNSCDVRIYNLSDETANKIASAEFTQLSIQAGYGGNFGLIFLGQIKQARRGRIDQKDSYVDLTAADGDSAYNFSTMKLSLSAGSKPHDAIQAFLAGMGGAGITMGSVPQFSSSGLPRGRVFYGLVRDELRDFARTNDCLWSIQDGKLTFIPQTAYLPGAIPVISAQTGLIGVPEQTANGIELRVLLNPAIKIGQRIKLDSTVNKYRYALDQDAQGTNPTIAQGNKLSSDGTYYVMAANHSGDTRGNEWYSDLICLAVNVDVIPLAITNQGTAGAVPIQRY